MNNSRLKFRAWDGNEMFPATSLRWSTTNDLQVTDDTFIPNETWLPATKVGLEVMQWTGLKDKSGTDIYEDDIVKIQLPMGGFWGSVKTEKIGRVKYQSDYGAFIVYWGFSKDQHHIILNCDIAVEAEIIGHAFENSAEPI